ncbi:MAG: HEAT repeat domain-containing protein [Aggregatilineales bacterium]
MDKLQHIFELAEEGEWTNGRAGFHKSFYEAIRELNDTQRFALVEVMNSQSSPIIRYSILEAIEFLKIDLDVEHLLKVMRDPQEIMGIRAKAGKVLTHNLDIADTLLYELVREDADIFIQREISMGYMLLMQESRPEKLETALINCLQTIKKSEDPFFIFELLITYKSPNIVDVVSIFLQDDRAFIRARAIATLTSSGDTHAISLIVPFLDDVNVEVRSQAIYSLRQQFNIDHTTVNTLRKATRALNDYNDSP